MLYSVTIKYIFVFDLKINYKYFFKHIKLVFLKIIHFKC